jgi:hypothetical protein
MACNHVATCPLFQKFQLNASLKVWKINYCEADHTRCARYELASSGQGVPLNLLPNGKTLNLQLLAG